LPNHCKAIQNQDFKSDWQAIEKEEENGTSKETLEAKESHWHGVEGRERPPNG
jgi:hypothetical protein